MDAFVCSQCRKSITGDESRVLGGLCRTCYGKSVIAQRATERQSRKQEQEQGPVGYIERSTSQPGEKQDIQQPLCPKCSGPFQKVSIKPFFTSVSCIAAVAVVAALWAILSIAGSFRNTEKSKVLVEAHESGEVTLWIENTSKDDILNIPNYVLVQRWSFGKSFEDKTDSYGVGLDSLPITHSERCGYLLTDGGNSTYKSFEDRTFSLLPGQRVCYNLRPEWYQEGGTAYRNEKWVLPIQISGKNGYDVTKVETVFTVSQ